MWNKKIFYLEALNIAARKKKCSYDTLLSKKQIYMSVFTEGSNCCPVCVFTTPNKKQISE